MLSDQEKREITEEVNKYQYKKAAGPEALKIVQRYRQWISDETLKEVADYLEVSPAELDRIATCYNLIFRAPVGRHIILLCDSVTCWIMGYGRIYEHLMSRLQIKLGQTTSDGRFTLLPVGCLGLCEQAPAMIIDEQTYGNLTPEKIDSILKQHT